VVYQLPYTRVFDRICQPHLVAVTRRGNRDGVALVISSPRRRGVGSGQLEEVRYLDQPLQFVGLLYRQLVGADDPERLGASCYLGVWAVRQGVGEAGVPDLPPATPSVAEGIKEKELLRALRRCGKLTAVGAALETALSVEETERMLEALAVKGHLKVSVEHGRLHALWERD
jgi:hypothetical protein